MEVSVLAVGFTVLVLLFVDTSVHCEKPSVVKVGAVFTFDSVIGRGAKMAMELAVEDVNSDPTVLNGTELKVIMEDLRCSVFMAPIRAFQVIEKDVVAIVGPQSSAIARIIGHITTGLQVPLVSYAATDPSLSSLQFPYVLRSTPTDSIQMSAIADVINFFKWKEVIAVFEDNDYGRNGVTALGDELAKKMSRISYKLPLYPDYNLSEVSYVLMKSISLGPRIYVVHISPDPGLRFFRIAKKLGMLSENYVWLATDWLSSTLDYSLPSDRDYLNILQGVVTLRPYIPDTPKKRAFMSRWRNMQQKGLIHSRLTAYGLYAYDTMWVLAHSINRLLNEQKITFSSKEKLQLGNLVVFDHGEVLLKFLLESNFSGLTGQIRFDDDRNLVGVDYEIINIVQEGTYKVGYWSNDTGLSIQSPEFLKGNKGGLSSLQVQRLDHITWPGEIVERPRGWVLSTTEKPLRIGVPKRVSFSEFVNHSHGVEGYCIDLFVEVLKLVPYDVPYRFEPFGDGLKNPDYDELVGMVANNVFDAAIGDIAIVTNRIKMVDFTQPFVATGLVIVAPIRNSTSSVWVFIRPFSLELWCATAASFVIIAVVIWMFEHRVNDDFRGPPRRQLRTMFLFSFSTLFKANHENTVSTLGKIVMVVWLFLLLVITSSYTASLSSIYTVQQLSTSITGLDDLVSSELPIGYQVGSFAYAYMKDSLNIHPKRLVSLGSPEEYEHALRRGPAVHGGVAAIVDENPYVELFLSKQSDYGIVGQPFTRRGWGFAFQKNSPLAIDMSTSILKLTESGKLQQIHEKWFCKSGCPVEKRSKPESNQLHLKSFLALYTLCGIFSLTALSLFLIRAIRQYIGYRRRQTDPSSPAFSASMSVVFSRVIRNFFEFIDEKEEAIKRLFAQHDLPSTQESR